MAKCEYCGKDVSFGINDIAYWTLLPAMSSSQEFREKTGAFARICANVGMYIVMVGWQPVTSALGDTPKAWFWCAVVIAVVYLLGLLFRGSVCIETHFNLCMIVFFFCQFR